MERSAELRPTGARANDASLKTNPGRACSRLGLPNDAKKAADQRIVSLISPPARRYSGRELIMSSKLKASLAIRSSRSIDSTCNDFSMAVGTLFRHSCLPRVCMILIGCLRSPIFTEGACK